MSRQRTKGEKQATSILLDPATKRILETEARENFRTFSEELRYRLFQTMTDTQKQEIMNNETF